MPVFEVEGEVLPPTEQAAESNRQRGQRERREREREGGGVFATAEQPSRDKPEKPRGRPKSKTLPEIKSEWARQIYGGHQLAVIFTGVQSFAITENEAVGLADPFVETLRWLGIPLEGGAFPPLSLIMAIIMVYGRKVSAIREEIAAKQAKEAEVVENDPATAQAPGPSPQWNVAA